MSIVRMTGAYGTFYTSANGTSDYLGEDYQKVNASYIKTYLLEAGWTINAIAGLIGNLEAESTLNPGRWEADLPYGEIEGRLVGVGIAQWTPYTKFTDWIRDYMEKGNVYNHLDYNLYRFIYEMENNLQWDKTDSYNFSFQEFSTSSLSPSTLAKAFLLNYEKPYDQSESVQAYRGDLADKWYTYLTGGAIPPIDPSIPEEPGSWNPPKSKRKRKYNFILFRKRGY